MYLTVIRDWSLITGRGGGYKTGGGRGRLSFTPAKRGGGESFSHAGGTTSFGVVFMRYLEVLAILMGGGGCKKFPPIETGGPGNAQSFTVSRGWGVGGGGRVAQKVLDPRFSHFVVPPPRN